MLLLYTGIITVWEGVYEFKFKMDHIYSTQHFDSIHFICGLWSLFIFHLSKMATEPKEE